MDGIGYEKYCAEYLRKQHFHNIEFTKTTGDQGIDIIAFSRGKKYGFQCKYYERPVGNNAVQQAYAGAAYYGCDIPAVISNSGYTASAEKLAEETDVILYDVQPEKKNFLVSIYQISCLLLSISGFLILLYCSSNIEIPNRNTLIWYAMILMPAGIFGCFIQKHLFISFFSTFCFIGCLVLSFFMKDENTFMLCLFILTLIITLISIISFMILLRKEHKVQKQIHLDLIAQDHQEELERIGKEMLSILQDDLHCHLLSVSSSYENDHSCLYTFKASRKIDDLLPVTEYSLNQCAKHSESKTNYTLQAINTKEFLLSVTVKDSE